MYPASWDPWAPREASTRLFASWLPHVLVDEGGEPVGYTSESTPREHAGCRLRAHEVPALGAVLEVVLSGRQDPEFWDGVHGLLREEVARSAPQYLVFDLRALDCIVGSSFLGGLVAGAIAMENQGKHGRTRILATGGLARRLSEVLPLCKLDPVLGGVHPDLPSALGAYPGHATALK
jgi:hypothetical protein